MQQTQTYKLNKPGADDPIAVAPLNENADKLEAALKAEAAARSAEATARANADNAEAAARANGDAAEAAARAALAQRVQALEAKKVYFGSFTGTGTSPQFVSLGYTPAAVILHMGQTTGHSGLLVGGGYLAYGITKVAQIVENGLQLYTDVENYNTQIFNAKGKVTYYIAFV